jgi:hypothetical protein
MPRLISAADLVPRNGCAFWFQCGSQRLMASPSRRTLSKLPRRIGPPASSELLLISQRTRKPHTGRPTRGHFRASQ